MKKTILVALAVLFAAGIALPQSAQARVFVGVGGGCCYGYGYGYPYPAYYYPYAVAPPPVVYAVPPASPTVYEGAPVVTQAAPASAPAPAPYVAAGSATFIDDSGRTCRHYEGPAPGSLNTACLQPDGTWHTVK